MSVVGIDLGTSDAIVAYVGKVGVGTASTVDIVQNEVSQRKTPVLVGFNDAERTLGDEAMASIKSNSANTARNMKHVLGRSLDDPTLADEKSFWALAQLENTPEGHIGYSVSYHGEQKVMSVQQITAAFLWKLRTISERWTTNRIQDCVISCPSYYTDVHRQAMLDACAIQGLNCLRLMNEHTAVALGYGIYRSNEFGEEPRYVAFASMGHSTFSVCIVKFSNRRLELVSAASDSNCGGRDMDRCLMENFAAAFQQKYKCDPLSDRKARFKLEDTATKAKKILSANFEATANVEMLMNDEDLSAKINRDDFEKMCEPMMSKIQAVLDRAVDGAPIPVEEISTVEIVGGASRVPFFQRLVGAKFGLQPEQLSRTLNADEAVARGCCLQAAMLSPMFKVREFEVVDNVSHGISVGYISFPKTDNEEAAANPEEGEEPVASSVPEEGVEKVVELIPRGTKMGGKKHLTLKRQGPFDLVARYSRPEDLPPCVRADLGSFRVELPPQAEPCRVQIKAELSLHGIFSIHSAEMLQDETYEQVTKERREKPRANGISVTQEDMDAAMDALHKEANGIEHASNGAPPADAADACASPPPEGEAGPEAVPPAAAPPAEAPPAEAAPEAPVNGDNGQDGLGAPAEQGDVPMPNADDGEKPAADQPPSAETGENGGAQAAESADGPAAEPTEMGEEPPAKKPKIEVVPEYEWVDVVKVKKRTKRIPVQVTKTGTPAMDPTLLARLQDEETAMQAEKRAILETAEARNDLESFILNMRNHIAKGDKYGEYISDADRDTYSAELTKSEDWLYDNFEGTRLSFIEKLDEIRVVGDRAAARAKDEEERLDAAKSLRNTIGMYKGVASDPSPQYQHLPTEQLQQMVAECDAAEQWLANHEAQQEAKPKFEDPVFRAHQIRATESALISQAHVIFSAPAPRQPPQMAPPPEVQPEDVEGDAVHQPRPPTEEAPPPPAPPAEPTAGAEEVPIPADGCLD
mmetsp:Transcript_47153/g.102623  ORF Transcript_47153/g.102623 Transcript_47153/m.102623 type:complete len:981 (-) Transcript_47153:258-3200(-)